jgi:hypothetical protein
VVFSWNWGTLKMTFETIWLAVLAAFLWGCVWWLATDNGLLPDRWLRGLHSWIGQRLKDEAYDDDVIDEDWALRIMKRRRKA